MADKDQIRERYQNDPEFRQRRRDAFKRWAAKNKEKHNSWALAWQKKDQAQHPEKWQAIWLAQRCKRYGVTVEWYEAQKLKQGNVCAICGKPETRKHHRQRYGDVISLAIDHNHQTKQVRELLCAVCNLDLHRLEDSGWLEKASQYLKRFN